MIIFKSMFIFPFLLIAQLHLFTHSEAAIFDIRNNCPYTVWAASVPVGGGQQLNAGQTWTINVPAGTKQARIWARTGCNFDGSGQGRCQTGDCNGLLQCQSFGVPPNSLAEYALNQFNNLDFFDISLVDGFNVPMEFSPTSNGCTRGIRQPYSTYETIVFTLFGPRLSKWVVVVSSTLVKTGESVFQLARHEPVFGPKTVAISMVRGRCQTGDCNGLLHCQSYGHPSNSLAEYALNQYSNLDIFDISLVDEFNVPIEFSPTFNGCTRGIRCSADINGQC
ncbi:hypothetical protein RND71_042878 [Anisodus tanguticus]|uniref:Thaumatin-like protein n=1 Tax=Anisodus tanguticus TaxID=243964 RepID=A0AAE1QRU1_9SOLA|nr:hypothetical protein RND71_042878 [Anisodus tanguticus]